MNKQIVVYSCNWILINNGKEWTAETQNNWMNFKTMILSDISTHKRVHIVWFHLHEILERQSKPMTTESRSVFARGRVGEEEECQKGSWGNFGGYGNVLHFDCGSGYMAIDICQNSLNCTLKMGVCPLLGIYTKKTKTLIRKDTCTPLFTAALFTTAKIWRQPKCPSSDEWIKKIWYIYTVEYYSAIKKN